MYQTAKIAREGGAESASSQKYYLSGAEGRGIAESIKSCVESRRPLPYNGTVAAFWLITEERSNLPEQWKGRSEEKDVMVMKESWWRSMGIEQLYR